VTPVIKVRKGINQLLFGLRARLTRVALANGIVVRRSNGVRRSVLVAKFS
jgi:hypothetical protein